MRKTVPTSQKQPDSSPMERLSVNECLRAFGREHLDSLGYAKPVGSVYVGEKGQYVKVGFSIDPQWRMRELRLNALAVAPGRMVDELGLHHLLRPYSAIDYLGEYYKPNPRLKALIGWINEFGTLPDEVVALGDCFAAMLIAKRHVRDAASSLGAVLSERAGTNWRARAYLHQAGTKAGQEKRREKTPAKPQES